MRVVARNIEEFLHAAGEREPALRAVDKVIRKAAPQLEPYFFNGMSMTGLGYGKYHYKYASGREGEWPLVGLAPQKNYMSLYVCAAKNGKYLPELYAEKLGKVNCGKSCIRFKKLEDLNLATVRDIVKEAAELLKDPKNFQF